MNPAENISSPLPTPAGFVPLIVPEIRGNEWKYVKDCLDTNWVSYLGSYVDRLEKLVAEQAETKYAVAMVNGTAALHIALMLAGVKPDDEVLVSTLSFIAPANAIRYVGAWPVFIDAELRHLQMDPARVVEFLETGCYWEQGTLRNRRTKRRVKAILPVHILGHPVDLDPILAVAEKYALPVIEDATEGLGSQYRGRSVGGMGHMGCFSFNGNKIITAGGGGMLVTNNAEWAERAKYLTTQAKDDPIEYVHHHVGYNYRLTNLLAAMGCAQMEQLDSFVKAKRQIAERYRVGLGKLAGLQLPEEASWAYSSFWMYTILLDESTTGVSARNLLKHLAAQRIQTRPLWQPLHRSPAHLAAVDMPCPASEKFYAEALSLPCSVGLTPDDQETVIEAIRDCITAATL